MKTLRKPHASDAALEARLKVKRPRPPEELVDALQDRIHPVSGRLIAAVPIKIKRT